ncbi:MAG: MlaD family protein [Saprospiraceae bacterium]|nr:MlaD family protein [Saprospiraceae bacterium]HMW40175.1 MlaD family protein [Saprospiraceae bacterium]HMX88255.1 MlaD family protein [Saprospiraceae bacterium]HMZ40716.1 MlaD family protein [Saprospiraceae bacterium]HNA64863.1 MlaD family protein [Saprospiraceae bacterium]
MKRKPIENIKLGLFVLSGMLILIFALYMLSKNRSFFSSRLLITTHFRNINGLLPGNNVRYNGIDIGNVKSIEMINDSTIKVDLSLKSSMKYYIRTSAMASVGTDGLIGNRIINISPGPADAPFLKGGENIRSLEEVNTEAMLRTLDQSNQNIGEITEEVKMTMKLIRNSSQLNRLLNDSTMSDNLAITFRQIRETAEKANTVASDALRTVRMISEGKGTLAALLTDTAMASSTRHTVDNLIQIEADARKLIGQLSENLSQLQSELQNSKGTLNTILRDTATANRITRSIQNIEKGTALFSEDMKALQSNFLLRSYFRKQKKESNLKENADSLGLTR